MPPPCERQGRRRCSTRSPIPPPCSTRSSRERPGRRARSLGRAHRTHQMSAPLKIPMPLRVPEFAPSLGRLLVPRRLEPPWVPLEGVREELATRVLELGGEARTAARRAERALVPAPVHHPPAPL